MGTLGVLSAVPPPPSGIKQLAELSAVSVLSVVSKHNSILEILSGNAFWTYVLEIHYGDTFWNINMFISCSDQTASEHDMKVLHDRQSSTVIDTHIDTCIYISTLLPCLLVWGVGCRFLSAVFSSSSSPFGAFHEHGELRACVFSGYTVLLGHAQEKHSLGLT